jgi:hypothetical protein
VLYLFTNALFEATKEIILKPEDWFTEIEIAEGKAYQVISEDKIKEIVLQNVTYNGTRHWVCPKFSGEELYKLIQQRALTYDPQTQRPTIKFVSVDAMNELPDIRGYKVNQIAQQILDGDFIGNTISINIRKTGFEEFDYDEETMTMTIPVKTENLINLIDGAHRTLGNAKAYQIDSDIDINWSLNIFNYDIKEARKFIKQEGKATPLTRKQLRLYGSDDSNISIAQDVNSFESAKTNILFNKLAENLMEIEYRNKYVTFETFAKAIKNNFEYSQKDPYQIQKIKENLVRGFNEILGYLQHKYGNIEKIKDRYTIVENNVFIGYVALLSKLWNKQTQTFIKNWDIELQGALNNIDFNRDNVDWEEISLLNGNINITTIKKISNYFIMKGAEVNGWESMAEII